MDRASSPFAYDDDGICFPPDPKARSGGTEKKESSDHPHNQLFQQSGKRSLTSYREHRPANVRDAGAHSQNQQSQFCQSSARHRMPPVGLSVFEFGIGKMNHVATVLFRTVCVTLVFYRQPKSNPIVGILFVFNML